MLVLAFCISLYLGNFCFSTNDGIDGISFRILSLRCVVHNKRAYYYKNKALQIFKEGRTFQFVILFKKNSRAKETKADKEAKYTHRNNRGATNINYYGTL